VLKALFKFADQRMAPDPHVLPEVEIDLISARLVQRARRFRRIVSTCVRPSGNRAGGTV
jgi:hypothetical protein